MKKALSLLISLVLLVSCVVFTASAAGTSMNNATPISFGSGYSGVMVEDSADYYKITLPSSGKITVSFSGNLDAINFCLLEANMEEIDRFYKTRNSNSDIAINIYLDFEYTVSNNYVVIVNYIGGDAYVTIPEYIENYTVIGIGKRAFKDKGVETVYVPATVTQFGEEAFDDSVTIDCIAGSAAETYAINNGLSCSIEIPSEEAEPNSNVPIIVVAAVVTIVAVAGVVAVIIIGKKNKSVR